MDLILLKIAGTVSSLRRILAAAKFSVQNIAETILCQNVLKLKLIEVKINSVNNKTPTNCASQGKLNSNGARVLVTNYI